MTGQHPESMQRTREILSLLFALFPLVLLMACQEVEQRAEAFSVSDSAGVTIVESVHPLWGPGEGWTLSREPEVVIGQLEGDERYLLSGVIGVRRLSDGRIAILDGGSYRVRVYDAHGQHLMDLGGEGDGPSEFRWPQFLGVLSDTLFVYEYVGGDLTWFSPDGGLVRTSSVFRGPDGMVPNVEMFGYLEDGVGIAIKHVASRDRAYVEGLNRPPMQLWQFDLFNSGADSLFSAPGFEQTISFPGGGVTGHHLFVFGKGTSLAVSKTQLYVGPTDAFSIQVFDGEGSLRRIIKRNEATRTVTAKDFHQWIEEQIEVLNPPEFERAEIRQSLGELSYAETMPAFRWMAVDPDDHLWVEEWEGVGWDQGRFLIFRPDGAWLGYVEVPEGLPESRWYPHQQVVEIGYDYLLGVWTDEYGVEQVRLYRIEKG